MLLLPAVTKRFTQGFKIAKMKLDFPHHPEWEVPIDSQIAPILAQPYFFLGKGSQCYVFESQDKKWVIKFFRYDHPISEDKIAHLFNACKTAYDFLKEETGIVYIHLNPTMVNLPTLYCEDPVGRRVEFDLNQCRFAIQKRAKPFRKILEEARKSPKQMQKRLDEFIDLLIARTRKGVLNSDPSLSRNFGFLEDRAIEIDFGNYRSVGKVDQAAEIKRYTAKLKKWLAPEWIPYLDSRVEAIQ